MAYATYQFFWGGKESDGATTAQHVEIAKKSAFAALVITDRTFEDAPDEVTCPFELEHVWEWFYELDGTRQSGMVLGPITNVEISAWASGMGIDLLPFERRAILAVDRAYLAFNAKKMQSKSGTNHVE